MISNVKKDVTLDKGSAMELVNNIKNFWHSKGYADVKVWLETIPVYNKSTGKKITTRFEVNSNIKQSLSSLETKHYI